MGFFSEAPCDRIGRVCVFCSKKSTKIGLAGLIVEGCIFVAARFKGFLAEVRVSEKAGVVHSS